MERINKRRGLRGVIVAILSIIFVGFMPSLGSVQAMTFDANRPVTWNQGSAPYSGNSFAYCSEGTFGPCACGIHSIAYLLLKTEYWEMGKIPTDAYALSQQYNIGSNYKGTPSYNWSKITEATNGKVKYVGDHWPQNNSTAHEIIREEYVKGNFMILSVKVGGTGHLIAVDYVDADGNIVILDSAINAKYLTQMDGNGYVRDIKVFSSDEVKSFEAAKYWEGDAVGQAGRNREINALKEELALLELEMKQAEIELQKEKAEQELAEQALREQEAKSEAAKENVLELVSTLKEEREVVADKDIESLEIPKQVPVTEIETETINE